MRTDQWRQHKEADMTDPDIADLDPEAAPEDEPIEEDEPTADPEDEA
jgi:hypothetical protein